MMMSIPPFHVPGGHARCFALRLLQERLCDVQDRRGADAWHAACLKLHVLDEPFRLRIGADDRRRQDWQGA
jgi:hypothetical protein